MDKNSRTGSRLFFIEFLIVLFFFLIISTVCLRLFVKSHTITMRANALSGAQSTAASVAAVISSGDGSAQSVASYFPEALAEGEQLTLFFDKDFQAVDSGDNAFYTMTILLNPVSNQEKTGLISVSDREESILYELPVSFHRPLTREEALQ